MTSSTVVSSQMPPASAGAPPQSKEPLTSSSSPSPEKGVGGAMEASRNDDSNPQQGTGAATGIPKHEAPPAARHHAMQRPSMKIPPTAKDERKLFVGGLPADGK